jgi:hypothetical protein
LALRSFNYASPRSGRELRGGIFDPAAGTPIPPRYISALIVGYDELSGTPYWIVKESNGTSWGMAGYAFIRRGQNALGIANFVVCPTA